jgi:DNA-binding MarR family transcriptional regulator
MTESAPSPLGCSCFRLRRLARTMSRVYDHHLAPTGLKTTQYSVLSHARRAALPVAELADRLGTERTTLTRNLKPLCEAGWIALLPGADSRQRIVTLTDAGHAKLKSAWPFWRAAQDAFERVVGVDAVRALHTQVDATLAQLTPLLEDTSDA